MSGENDGGPVDPMTAVAEGAVGMHVAYLSFVEAGFTEGQAMAILLTMLTAVLRNQNGPGGSE